ncbi:MAG TPA: NUDIX domain-containing protein [Candidatus Saccharimonadales bacterium]|nr:NUDIX domain-containing protein [Candidatus Saccharimonadales bacterium]
MALQRRTARAIIIHDNQILLVERWRPGHHYFSIPGGGIEPAETPEQTMQREVAEETGCVVQTERQIYFLQLADGTEHYFFLARYISGEPHLPADSPEALGNGPENRFLPRWVPLVELPELPFLVWLPIKEQLVHDLHSGFPDSVLTLAG